jgi:hypothetical protein
LSREITVEQHFAIERMDSYRRAQRVLEAVDRSEREALRAIAEDDRRDDDVQAIETARDEETRESVGAALDENAAQSDLGEAGEYRGRRYIAVYRGQSENLDAGEFATRALFHHDDSAHAVIGEQAGRRLESAARIDDDARRIGANDVTNRQSRVIRDRAADPDDDGVDEGA